MLIVNILLYSNVVSQHVLLFRWKKSQIKYVPGAPIWRTVVCHRHICPRTHEPSAREQQSLLTDDDDAAAAVTSPISSGQCDIGRENWNDTVVVRPTATSRWPTRPRRRWSSAIGCPTARAKNSIGSNLAKCAGKKFRGFFFSYPPLFVYTASVCTASRYAYSINIM